MSRLEQLAGRARTLPRHAPAYEAAGNRENLTVFDGTHEEKTAAAVEWLLEAR